MTPEQEEFARLRALFERAVGMPLEERRAFVASECDGNPGMRRRLEAMLDEDAVAEGLLERGRAAVTKQMLGALEIRACGPYVLEGVIGEGGMGVVYRGRREDLGSVAAIKVLRDAWVSPQRRERFRKEQRTLARLNHPGIARLLDAGVTVDGTPWIAMELVEGERIHDYCALRGLDVGARLRLFLQVCEAVQYAHERAVIHRDLKPSNILVNGAGAVRLVDFGISKQLEETDGEAEATRTEFRWLTPKYAAPEQVRGEVGVYTDVYALGVLLRELLEGAREKGARDEAAWDELRVVEAKAAHPDFAQRYRTVEALGGDVRRYLAGQPLEAKPDSRAYRLRKFVARNRAGVAAATAGLLVVVSLSGYFTWRLKQSRDEAVAAAARAERIQAFLLNLFEGGDKAGGPRRGLTVETLIDRGVREAAQLDGEPAVQAEVFDTLGRMYGRLGRYEAAEKLLAAAIKRGRGGAQELASRVELALLRAEQGRLEEAEALAREAMSRSPQAWEPREALGRVLTERGRYDDAVAVLEPVLAARRREPGAPDRQAAVASALAAAHFYAGRYAEAGRLNEEALELRRQAHGERHPLVAAVLIDLGAIAFDTGRYAQAEPYFRQALERYEKWYGESHPETGSALTMLGRDLLYQKKNEEARRLLERALAIQEAALGGEHGRVASVLNDLGNLALGEKRYEEAEAAYGRMEEIYRRTRGEGHYLVATALSNRATVRLERGEYARAEAMYRDVVARYEKALPAGHVNTAVARIRLGRSLLRQRRFGEAVAESQAGYQMLRGAAHASVSWLQGARQDLAAAYAALGEGERAAQYRREWEEGNR